MDTGCSVRLIHACTHLLMLQAGRGLPKSRTDARLQSAAPREEKSSCDELCNWTLQKTQATVEQVLDSRTMHVLSKFLKRGLFAGRLSTGFVNAGCHCQCAKQAESKDEIHGCISTGKEANATGSDFRWHPESLQERLLQGLLCYIW